MKMNFLLILTTAVTVFATLRPAQAGEPPASVGLKDKIRMSSLVVLGHIEKVAIVNAKTLKELRKDGDLKAGEQAWVRIKIERVLFASPEEAPAYKRGENPGTVDIAFGSTGMDVKGLEGSVYIFFLTRDFDKMRLLHYPFYDWTNLYAPLDEEKEVTRLITAFDAIK